MKTPKPSLRRAINAKCADCIHDPQSGLGTWRQQVEACPATDCPLWSVRPKSDSRDRAGNARYALRASEKAAPCAQYAETNPTY